MNGLRTNSNIVRFLIYDVSFAWAESIAFSSDACILAGGYSDGAILLWDVIPFLIEHVPLHLDPLLYHNLPDCVSSVAHSLRLCFFWTTANGVIIYRNGITIGKRLKTLTDHTAKVNNLCFSPGSYTLVSGSEDGIVLLWE